MSLTLTEQLLERSGLNAGERRALLDAARRLRDTRRAEGSPQPLKGRHVAIAGVDHEAPSARLFERAATALGARVSHIGPQAAAAGTGRDEVAARVLGSLYDAVDCVALPAGRAVELHRLAGVPVFADLGGEASPLRALLAGLAPEAADESDLLMCLVQAVLVETVG